MCGSEKVSAGSFVDEGSGKKLALWHEDLVLMDCSLLLDGRGLKRLWPGLEGSAAILSPLLMVLDANRS